MSSSAATEDQLHSWLSSPQEHREVGACIRSFIQPAWTELLLPDLQGDELQPVPWGGGLG